MPYLTFCFILNKIINIGAPTAAVITPMGISIGEKRVRESISQTTINIAAARQALGIRILWFGPTTNRIVWGITRPTNPIMPLIDTILAVIKEVIKNNIFFVAS